MKFGLILIENRIVEWKDFYIDYETLKTILNPLKKKYEKRQVAFNKKKRVNRSDSIEQSSLNDTIIYTIQEEQLLLDQFEVQIILELKKVDSFFYQRVIICNQRRKEIKEQLEFSEENREYERFNVQ